MRIGRAPELWRAQLRRLDSRLSRRISRGTDLALADKYARHVCVRCCFGAALTRSPSGSSLNFLSIDDRNVNGDVLAGGSADLTNSSSESYGLAQGSLSRQFIQETIDDVGGKRISRSY